MLFAPPSRPQQIELRPYQARDVNALREQYRRGKRAPLYVLPTAGGKTYVFGFVTQQAVARGKRVLILVHRDDLLLQASLSLDELGIEHGLIAAGYTEFPAAVQVASVQTLVRRLDRYPEDYFDLVVIDEAHYAVAGSWRTILAHFRHAYLLGVTATPCRLDGAGLGAEVGGVFDALVVGPTIRELIAEGYLAQPVVHVPPSSLDLSGVHSRAGDYAIGELERAVDRPTITGDVVSHYRQRVKGAPAIAFCTTVAHAQHVASEFRADGFRAAALEGTIDKSTRRGMLRSLGSGELQVVTSCELVSEGTDVPALAAVSLVRPSESLRLYLQQVGRALRRYPGKDRALILDHVGNVARHGQPDQDRKWTLLGWRAGGPKPRSWSAAGVGAECPRCGAMRPPGVPKCVGCGHVTERGEREQPEIEHGELVEVTSEVASEMERRRRRRMISRARTREQLEAVARELDYKPRWVDHILEAREQKKGKKSA